MKIFTFRTVWDQELRVHAKFRSDGFLKYANFYFSHSLRSLSACSCKISSRSDEWLQSYCKFSISKMAAVRHLGYLKYANFHLQHGLGSPSCSPTPISNKMQEFWRFGHKYGPNCILFNAGVSDRENNVLVALSLHT